MNVGSKLPEEMIAKAEQKFAGFRALKSEIDDEMARAHEALDGVRRKIRENIYSNENKDGLLTGKHDDYLQCLEMNYRDLELLLRKDEAKWAENIEITKSKANEACQKLQAFFARQNAELEALMNSTFSVFSAMDETKLKFDLRYLPLWGELVSLDKTDFRWPTKEQVDGWSPSVSLKSITFTTHSKGGDAPASVKCILTNNESSPLFHAANNGNLDPKTINFHANRPVQSVQAFNDGSWVSRIYFLDKDRQEIDNYNPLNLAREGPIHVIGDKEELIGVYGVRNKRKDYFTSFGFILKVRQE